MLHDVLVLVQEVQYRLPTSRADMMQGCEEETPHVKFIVNYCPALVSRRGLFLRCQFLLG